MRKTTKISITKRKIPYKYRSNIMTEFCDCDREEEGDDELIFEDEEGNKFLINDNCRLHGVNSKESPF